MAKPEEEMPYTDDLEPPEPETHLTSQHLAAIQKGEGQHPTLKAFILIGAFICLIKLLQMFAAFDRVRDGVRSADSYYEQTKSYVTSIFKK